MKNYPWALIEQWPANGEMRELHRWGIKAAHYPATKYGNEKLVIIDGDTELTRRKINNKFALPTMRKV